MVSLVPKDEENRETKISEAAYQKGWQNGFLHSGLKIHPKVLQLGLKCHFKFTGVQKGLSLALGFLFLLTCDKHSVNVREGETMAFTASARESPAVQTDYQ